MLAAIASKLLAWLGGRGLRILVREVADALEEAEKNRDYELAIRENAIFEAAERERKGRDATREDMHNANVPSDPDAVLGRLRSRDPNAR